ncbi:MAG: hypothetical protein ABI036_10490 [Fibrobacteria bacterium]
MATPHLAVHPLSRIASGLGLALAISMGQAEAQAPTQLTQLIPSIRNFEWVDPMDRTDSSTIEARIAALPKLLSGTGLYRNIGDKSARAISDTSVVPYQINSALWSDGAHKERYISLLPGSQVVPTDTSQFTFPDGAMFIKNFLIDTVYGDSTGDSRIFVETRFLVYRSGATGKRWSGISYRWRRDQSDAELVHPDSGLDFAHNVRHNGRLVGKRWRYPSGRNCNNCHRGNETDLRGTLGFITPQLNRVVDGTNQLQSLFARGILSANPVAGKPDAHRWYALAEDSIPLEKRVRSYFASNCSHCHNVQVPLGLPDHDFDYFDPSKRINFQLDSAVGHDPTGGWVNAPSKSGNGFDFLLLPGYPDSSAIMNKMRSRLDAHLNPDKGNFGQMPPLATSQPDSAAVKLIEQWICSLKPGTSCGTIPWAPDETFWADPVSVALRPHGNPHNPDFQPCMREGRLSIPAHFATFGVELRDYQGRKIPMAQVGKGEYRLPRTLTPGIYFLVAGEHRVPLNYIP